VTHVLPDTRPRDNRKPRRRRADVGVLRGERQMQQTGRGTMEEWTMIFHIFIPADMDRLIRLVRDFLALLGEMHSEVMSAEFIQKDEED
jgi:hypothetical protein